MVIKVKPTEQGIHAHVGIYSGEDVDHLHYNGTLSFGITEWGTFLRALEKGTDYTGTLLLVENVGAS